jgi:putative heme-binding domain-containing protein
LIQVIRGGLAGGAMPAFNGYPDEENNIVAYIRSLTVSGPAKAHNAGDATKGQAVYERYGCSGCHRIGESGSVFGPELTRVGAARSYDYLKRSLLDPSADITPGSEGITAVTSDGRRVSGTRVNEDTFTVQLRDQNQQFVMLEKSELKSLTHETKSFMPAYTMLSGDDLENLLAWLTTLHGDVEAGAAKSPRLLR